MKEKRRKVWLCLIGILSCAILMVNNQVLAATPSYHAYSGGVTRGTIRYVSQSTSTASDNGWGAYASKANGECGYASQSMALSYIGKDISPEYLCHGEYAQGKWHTGYGNGISGMYEIDGISVVSGSGNPTGSTAVNTINSMLTNFMNDNGKGQYSPVVIHYGSSSVMHAIIVIGKEANGNYLTLDPARGMNVVSMTLSSVGAVGGNVTYAANGCKINGVQQYYNASSNGTEKPTNVVLALEKTTFFSNEHVTYYCAGDNVDYYVISIYDDRGNVIETVKVLPGEYCTRYYEPGNYMAYCEGYNSCGNTFSNTLKFIVKSSTETIPHIHDYISTIKKPATCTKPGIMLFTCKDNDDSYEEKIPPTGHQHTELRNVKAATCAQEGYTGDTYCKDCNTKLSSGKSIAKKDHTWDSGKITTVATCNGKGIKTYTCTGCNATRTEEIPSTGHQHTELRNVKAATCAQEGYTGDTYCKDCNMKLASGKVLPKTDHIWDTGKETQNATCTAKGIKTFTCTVCNSTRIEEIPATGHVNKIIKFAKEASCKSEGYTGDVYCQDCDILIEEGKIIPKTEHVWNDGEITTSSTCTTEGTKTYTCTSCGTTKTEAIAATGHGATEIRNKKDASVTSEGYTGDTYCTICNQKISSGNTIAKLTPQTATPGKTLKDKSTNGVYKVLQDGVSVEFTKPVYKKASVRIPDTINVNGITCKVTGISANAFKNNKPLKSVSIGRNVTVIGTNAFYGCKKLSKVSGGNGIVKIGHRAFANCSSLSKITIPGSVTSIGKQAFCNCKKLRSITIKTSTLSGKTVGSKAFAGTYKKPTVKVPASQLKTYKKLLKVRGMSSKAVYRK